MLFRSPSARLAAGVLLGALLFATPAFAVSWNRVSTIDAATATNNALCAWSTVGAGTLECSSTNPTIFGSFLGIVITSPQNALDIGISQGIRIASGIPTNTNSALYNNGGTPTWNGAALTSLSGGDRLYLW